jgi:hypothetical protein
VTVINRRPRGSANLSNLVDRLKGQFPELPQEHLEQVAAGDELRLPSADPTDFVEPEPEPAAPRRQHRA